MADFGPKRSRRLAFVWGAAFLVIAAFAAAGTEWRHALWAPAGVLLLGALLLSLRSTVAPTRIDHDLSTPLVVMSAFVMGAAAPAVVMAQAAVIAIVDKLASGKSWAVGIANMGAIGLWHASLGFAAASAAHADLSPLNTVPVLLVAIPVAMTINHLTVSASVRYLHGSMVHPLKKEWLRDGITSLGVALPSLFLDPTIGATVGLVVLGVVVAAGTAERDYREHRAAIGLEVQARIVSYEATHGLEGHTERVVEYVRHMARNSPAEERDRLIAAAWIHSAYFAGYPHRCNGILDIEYLRLLIARLPRLRHVRPLLKSSGMVNDHDSWGAHVLAGACGWDARLLMGSPVAVKEDLHHAYGVAWPIASALALPPRDTT